MPGVFCNLYTYVYVKVNIFTNKQCFVFHYSKPAISKVLGLIVLRDVKKAQNSF